MLSYPDYSEKQILFLNNDIKQLKFSNDNIVVYDADDKIKHKISCHKIFCIFVIGELTITSVLIRKVLSFGISIVMMTKNFKVYALIGAETEGNYILREKQYLMKSSLPIAKQLVQNKIQNQLTVLKKNRDKTADNKLIIKQIKILLKKVAETEEEKSLLGLEGSVAKLFFQDFFKDMKWHKREPRTKTDITNLLLDIGYTYLFNFIDAHLRLYGFDNYVGVYHKNFYQRKSLVCDLIEPFRCIIDMAIKKAHNLNQIEEKDFVFKNGSFQLPWQNSSKYTKILFCAIMEHKKEIFVYTHDFYKTMMKSEEKYPVFLIS